MMFKDELYTNENSHPIILYLRTKKLIPGFETWEGDVVITEIERLTGQKPTIANINKLMAAKTLLISDAPWQHWEVFNHVVMGLNGYIPNTDILHKPALHELIYGVETINMLREENFREESDVPKYVAAVMLDENVQYAPHPLEFAQMFILAPKYVCKKCGARGNGLEGFIGMCRDCGSTDYSLEMEYDIAHQKALYEEYLKKDEVTVPEEMDAIAAGKLLLARKYADLKRKELGDQYKLMSNLL